MGTFLLLNGATLTWTKEVLPTGKQNSTEMLLDSKDDSNFADSMMKTNSHMGVQKQRTENDVKKMTLPSLTVKDLFAQDTTRTPQSVVSNKSPKVSPSGLNDMSPHASFNQLNKSNVPTNGSVNRLAKSKPTQKNNFKVDLIAF